MPDEHGACVAVVYALQERNSLREGNLGGVLRLRGSYRPMNRAPTIDPALFIQDSVRIEFVEM